jgi:RNA polymerase sigma factor (sigma-70 family)
MRDSKKPLVERLFEQHRAALQGFFARRVRIKQDAPDLVQEVYLRMLRVKDADALRNPEGYLFTVASNLVYEQAVLNRRQTVDLDRPGVEQALAAPARYEEMFDDERRVQRLNKVLAELSPKCRATVYMKYQHGLSYEEIAQQIGVSPHMVQKYLGIALAHCRRRMARLK